MPARDGLPESTNYQDDGCDLHDHCLTCPLPACRYELPPGRARALSQAAALRTLLSRGQTMDEAATNLGVSRRTVYRLRRVAMTLEPVALMAR
jgi:transcriptional regulator of acetoin/glycerol metabolism